MTTLEEEDDLFGAHLSLDFELDAQKNRPWQSARSQNSDNHHYSYNEHPRDAYREPYELLDDVPPANIPSQANLIQPRYEYPVDDDTHNARRRVTFRLENDSSPYSIDNYSMDYSDVEVFSTSSKGSKISFDNTYPRYAENDNIFITESRSDSEMSTYQSMNDNDYSSRDENEYYSDDSYEYSAHRASPGSNERSRYEYDNNSYESGETDFDSTDRSRSSMSTFDRFYRDGHDEGITNFPGTHMSERSAEVRTSGLEKNESLGATIYETLRNDSFNFTSYADRSPEENTKGVEKKVDGSAPTPLRSNARTNALGQTNSGRREESDDVFRIHGADSFLSSKSGGLSAGVCVNSSGSDMGSPNSSQQSEDSAVQHLADFHKLHKTTTSPKKSDPPEESANNEDRFGERSSAQEPDGYKQFGLFPDMTSIGYPREKEDIYHETEDSEHKFEDVDSQETDGYVFNQREPTGECYNDIKHKLVHFEDVYEEDEVERGRHENIDFDFATDISFSSSNSSCHGNARLIIDDASVISEDTDIRRLAKQHILRDKDKQTGRRNTFAVKDKDSMESGIKINSEGRNLVYSSNAYSLGVERIKENDSMESYMNIDIERKGNEDHSIVSPPLIKRMKFNFADMKEESLDDMRSFGEASVSTQHYSSDDESEAPYGYESEDHSFDDEIGTSDDPSLFPSKSILQMNLNQSRARASDSNISGDLIERACSHLSRGRNVDALDTLTIALNRAENSMNHAKVMLDEHYLSKKRGSKIPGMNAGMNEEAFEDQLNANFQRAASEMADVMNNIGVVHEMNGDVQKAMNSFREALTVYRNTCHRFENTGDSDVDRTVSNIMQMGIAMRSQQRRLELHSKARKLEKRILSSDDSSTRLKLSMERLNVLMCIIDVESESLGRNHPSVGFTLMAKGNLHLQLNHIDQAITDCRDAIGILKKGLGHIHPEVGRAMVRLADIFNYHSNGDWESEKDTARSLYQESLTPLRESFGDVNSDLALANNSIGIIYALKNETKNAMKFFYDALAGYGVKSRADEEPCTTSVSPDVFFVWINVGDLHLKRNEWQLALRSFQKACTSFRSMNNRQKDYLRNIGPRRIMRLATSKSRISFDDDETLLSSVLQKIGKAQCLLQKYGKSVETLQEALRIQKVLAMRCGGMNSNCTREIARVLGNLGEVQMLSGDLTSSLQSYLQSLDVLRSSGCGDESIEVALVLGAIGQLHMKRRCYAEAIVTLQHCIRIFDSNGVPDDNIRIKETRSNLIDAELALKQNKTSTLAGQGRDSPDVGYDDRALAVDEIANTYKIKGDYSGAIWLYTEALDIRRKRIKALTEEAQKACESVDIGKTICNIAQMRSLRGEFEAASILFDEVKHIYHAARLPEEHPFYKDYLDQLSIMRKM